ncbi:ABC transporter ATP-binding protein [Faecalibacter rhinopitheci]|uniref:ATP-binding cassette domain-containing protein n=1 Tax=Faecalibacter rhinopitheci TaxID=2779678 RepID=A0A8J7KAJ8_9FLAO|nr:ATP-binding cassette domain-containing protein [Faecalibacter rhinopitheci]MBF0597580.1 ATP-binding cassette domain-containing protein [Faecalibacter rhinopitheci]MBQ0148630.1 ATP-binding cassette domain-containing protein [Candidatus Onthonaster equi]
MIEVKEIRKSFGDIDVLKGFTLKFEKGNVNLIIGQSGSGKTVFLKNLIGLFSPTSGKILYEGEDMESYDYNEKQRLRSEIGVVFQGSALYDTMNILDNVKFPLEMFSNMSTSEIDQRAREVLDRVEIARTALKKFPSEISGGMQKRVAIARAIVNKPKYLFADEPNSGLDPKTALVIDQLIYDITKELNTTTIINTHDMNSVMEIGDHIVFLKNGFLEWEGTKDEILVADNPAVIDFVYSSNLFKKLREALLKEK